VLTVILRRLIGFWRTSEETGEKVKNPNLQTRYYRIRMTQLIDKIEYIVQHKLKNWKIVHINRERGEIILEKKHLVRTSDVVITVYDMPAFRSAVDITSAIKGPFGDLGLSCDNIIEFFGALGKELEPGQDLSNIG